MDCRSARNKNPDLWIETCPEASRAACEQLREWILTWEPELVESIKWNMLCYSGKKLVCAVGGYKKHAALIFFRGRELPGVEGLCDHTAEVSGLASLRVTSPESVDRGAVKRFLRAAVRLDESVPPPRPERTAPRSLPEMPPAMARALRKNSQARKGYEALSNSSKREYLVWVGSAKRPETMERRLTETIAALESGRKWMQRKG